jgi:hypothetical protein
VGCVVIVLIVIAIAVILVRRSHRQARPGEVSAMTMARFRNRRAHAEPDEWEIDRELLIFTDRKLGSGHFGQVVFAALQDPMTGMGREVAVKQIVNAIEGSKEEREFVQEMSLMKALAGRKEAGQPAPEPYPFVVGLLGVCTLNEPLLLVLDYADQGDLAHYLKDKRPKRGARATQADVKMLLTLAAQCACGMDFLERHRVRPGVEMGWSMGVLKGDGRQAEVETPCLWYLALSRPGRAASAISFFVQHPPSCPLLPAHQNFFVPPFPFRSCTVTWPLVMCSSTGRRTPSAKFPISACPGIWRHRTTMFTSCQTRTGSCP